MCFDICIIFSAPKPIYKENIARKTIGNTNRNLPEGFNRANESAKGASPSRAAGLAFQNTSDHIRAITYKVTKLAKIKARINRYSLPAKLSRNKLISGQKPDNGGIPTKENKTIAIKSDRRGYSEYIPPNCAIFVLPLIR